MIVGSPGLLHAFLTFVIRTEDRTLRTHLLAADEQVIDVLTLKKYVTRHWRFLISFMPSVSFIIAGCYTLIAWTPAYYGSAFGWDHSVIGLVYAGSMAVGAISGIFLGRFGDSLSRNGIADGIVRMFIVLLGFAVPARALGFLGHNS